MNQKIVFAPDHYIGQTDIVKFSECLSASIKAMDFEHTKQWKEKTDSRDSINQLGEISLAA